MSTIEANGRRVWKADVRDYASEFEAIDVLDNPIRRVNKERRQMNVSRLSPVCLSVGMTAEVLAAVVGISAVMTHSGSVWGIDVMGLLLYLMLPLLGVWLVCCLIQGRVVLPATVLGWMALLLMPLALIGYASLGGWPMGTYLLALGALVFGWVALELMSSAGDSAQP